MKIVEYHSYMKQKLKLSLKQTNFLILEFFTIECLTFFLDKWLTDYLLFNTILIDQMLPGYLQSIGFQVKQSTM